MAPDLAEVPRRLRAQWLDDWLADPQKIQPGTRMPSNFPKDPHYLGPFMPWAAWRFMTDEELWSIVAYLRHVKPISNKVEKSDDTPDHWASVAATLGAYPPPPFPTVNEVRRR